MQELKSLAVIMIAFMKEMKQQSQSNLENLGEMGQPRQEVIFKLERQFSNELKGHHSENLREAGEFYYSLMQAEVGYLSLHRREGVTLEKVAWEKPNAVRATTPQRIFAYTNPITQPVAYEGGFSFSGD